MYKKLVTGLCVLVLFSCGGGGSNDSATTPSDPNQTFSLSALQSTALGTVYTSRLAGSDSNGVSYTGSVSMANRPQTLLNGVLVTPQDSIINLTGGGTSITVTGTSNIDTNGNLIIVVIQTTGVVCTPVSPDSMPSSVKIGDFGILSSMTCSDNTVQERNWRIEDAGNGLIDVVTNGTIKNQFNSIVSTTDVTFTIDDSGNIVSFKTVTTQSVSNFTLTYQSA